MTLPWSEVPAEEKARLHLQSKCPQCAGAGTVCTHCGYGGSMCDGPAPEDESYGCGRHEGPVLCPSCKPDGGVSIQ